MGRRVWRRDGRNWRAGSGLGVRSGGLTGRGLGTAASQRHANRRELRLRRGEGVRHLEVNVLVLGLLDMVAQLIRVLVLRGYGFAQVGGEGDKHVRRRLVRILLGCGQRHAYEAEREHVQRDRASRNLACLHDEAVLQHRGHLAHRRQNLEDRVDREHRPEPLQGGGRRFEAELRAQSIGQSFQLHGHRIRVDAGRHPRGREQRRSGWRARSLAVDGLAAKGAAHVTARLSRVGRGRHLEPVERVGAGVAGNGTTLIDTAVAIAIDITVDITVDIAVLLVLLVLLVSARSPRLGRRAGRGGRCKDGGELPLRQAELLLNLRIEMIKSALGGSVLDGRLACLGSGGGCDSPRSLAKMDRRSREGRAELSPRRDQLRLQLGLARHRVCLSTLQLLCTREGRGTKGGAWKGV